MQKINALEEMARTLVTNGTASLDDDRTREDLIGLYMDIRAELRSKAPDSEKEIYVYAALLQEEIDQYSPYKAYEAGALLGCNPGDADKDMTRAFMRYICRTEFDPASKDIHSKVGIMYSELCGLLGDTRGLMDDFTELYRKCCGIIKDKLELFFSLGYAVTYAEATDAGGV